MQRSRTFTASARPVCPALAAGPEDCQIDCMVTDLYHNRILELAADIPNLGQLSDPDGRSHKVSRVCGSEVWVDVNLSDEGTHITGIAVQSKACALGAATLSILSEHATGATTAEVIAARDQLKAMLKQGAEPPDGRFWELRHLSGVMDYPQRHQSTLLAFEAAAAAISDAQLKRGAKPDAVSGL
jgi:NifU-like protein involved in Fe-S cluster formation